MDILRKNRLIWLSVLAVLELCKPACIAQVYPTVDSIAGGTNFDVYVLSITTYNSNGQPSFSAGPLVSVTDGTNNIPFRVVSATTNQELIAIENLFVPADVLTYSLTLMWANYTNNVPVVTGPIFVTSPQNQSVFVGATATFSTLAVHATGCQWQLNGTNLVESSHYIGVTNSTLTISNLQMSDAGNYTVVAGHPLNPSTNTATLSVYKPIILGLGTAPPAGGFTLSIANADGSPFEPSRIPNLQVYSTTNLSSDVSSWNLEINTGAISNGILQIPFPGGSPAKYWRVFEQ